MAGGGLASAEACASNLEIGSATTGFPLTREHGCTEHIPKVRSNNARTQTAIRRELGLTPCGELAGVVEKTLMCRGSVHANTIGEPPRVVNIGRICAAGLDLQ